MANAWAEPQDIYAPEVLGDMIRLYTWNKAALLGNPYVVEIPRVTWANGGNTATFPTLSFSTAVSTLPITNGEDTSIESGQLTMSSDTATVINRIVPFGTSEAMFEDIVQGAADMPEIMTEIAQYISDQLANDVDSYLLTEAYTSTLSVDNGTALTPTDIVEARGKYGDKMSEPMLLVMHSVVYQSCLTNGSIQTASVWGGAPVLVGGEIDKMMGVPIAVSDNITLSGGKYKNVLLRMGGIGVKFKRQVSYRKVPKDNGYDRHEFTIRFITHLNKVNNKDGCVIVSTTA